MIAEKFGKQLMSKSEWSGWIPFRIGAHRIVDLAKSIEVNLDTY